MGLLNQILIQSKPYHLSLNPSKNYSQIKLFNLSTSVEHLFQGKEDYLSVL
jgi:hypothetical protein